MTIREEFEKAFEEFGSKKAWIEVEYIALWAAKWMAERCAIEAEKDLQGRAYEIRQLAKELDHAR